MKPKSPFALTPRQKNPYTIGLHASERANFASPGNIEQNLRAGPDGTVDAMWIRSNDRRTSTGTHPTPRDVGGLRCAGEFCPGATDRPLRQRAWAITLAVSLSVLVSLGTGCSGNRYLTHRSVRDNPLTAPLQLLNRKGPQVSDRTWYTLRRYGLRDRYEEDAAICLSSICNSTRENRDPELIHSLAELSYVEGKKAEKAGKIDGALGHYAIALTTSYDYLFSEDLQKSRNSYDPQFRATCDIYNESLEDTLRLLCKDNCIKPEETYRVKTPDREFVIHTRQRGNWDPETFDHYEFVSDYEIETLRSRHTTFGLGVPLIAVRKSAHAEDRREKHYPEGLSFAVTAMLRCGKDHRDASDETPVCVLEFFDPLAANQVKLADQWVPLETDLTAPLAFFLDTPRFREQNTETQGLLNPASVAEERGLYMLEPYDPNRIPVLMVHGLWSSPRTWMDMFNDLRSFPEIRQRYQFWFYLYPSGQPFWVSATQLRSDLKEMRDTFDPTRRDASMDKMVLVGHSMGGLISRLQTIDSRDDFWSIVSDQSKEKLQGSSEQREKLVSALFFKPNRSIRRVITIGTPHRGSRFANDVTRWLARKVIKLPSRTVSIAEDLVRENPELFHDTELLTTSTAIDSLAPESPIFQVMLRANYAPSVQFHNIIGVIENPTLLQKKIGRGDGVVTYDSAHMEDTESELVIDADHTTIHQTGQAIFEVRRILLEHLHSLDAEGRVAVVPAAEPVPAIESTLAAESIPSTEPVSATESTNTPSSPLQVVGFDR